MEDPFTGYTDDEVRAFAGEAARYIYSRVGEVVDDINMTEDVGDDPNLSLGTRTALGLKKAHATGALEELNALARVLRIVPVSEE
jgi:uncharacterized protein (UPF0147 family)